MEAPTRVYTISPGAPFLATLADALLEGRVIPGWPERGDPLALAEATIFLPTRRAARAFATLLAERVGAGAVLLPRLMPLGDVDAAEEAALFDALRGGLDDPALPPEAPETQRRLELARLVLAWARQVDRAILKLDENEPLLVPSSPADALGLAADLGSLIDTLSIHGKTFEDVHKLVPDRFDPYWDITRRFLAIAAEAWPENARQNGVMDAALRRHQVLTAEAERLLRDRPDAPMVVAGSTGSMPATAALIGAVARLPRGAVVLPGLDLRLDEPSWRRIPPDGADAGHPGHPQALLSRLIGELRVPRAAVGELGRPAPALEARERFLSEALRPAETTDLWAAEAGRLPSGLAAEALAGIAVVEAADDREEAQAIAVALRHALEDPQATAALITPDRTLAERVCAELKRWDIPLDDSAGQPLGRTGPGVLARLTAEAAAEDFAAAHLLALLDHPLCRLGLPRTAVLRGRSALEIGVLRGPVLPRGLEALAAAMERAEIANNDAEKRKRMPGARKRLHAADWQAARDVVAALRQAFAGFQPASGAVDLVALVGAHQAALEAIGQPAPEEGGGAFADPAGEELLALFDEATQRPVSGIEGRFSDYPAFFSGLMSGRVARRPDVGHPRLRIWGLLEARLLTADLVVLGGLDEKTWPPEARSDAFLNRPMRQELGLPSPERRIGQTAHDFVQAMGARRVILTRALKRGGDPTVQSRMLQRMQAVAGKEVWKDCRERGERLLALARLLDRPAAVAPARRPRPKPPADKLPTRLSVTEIETLVRDPYSIYAKHVLRLDPLDDLAAEPSAAVKGVLIHEVIGRFAKAFPKELPGDVASVLLAYGREEFAQTPELRDRPDVVAFWWPRFERMAAYLGDWERRRRAGGLAVEAEIGGKLAMMLADGSTFELTGRADRIELLRAGGFAIVDFKTGAMPGVKEVRVGFSPQLTLEAAMAKRGAFQNVPAGLRTEELLYVKLSGAAEAGQERSIADPKQPFDVDELAEEHLENLQKLLADYRAGERAFLSRPHPKFAKRYAPYDHLARVREWSLAGAEGEEG
ncbi:double-strand break repair protein AddB [Alsobacter soli]|uniref:Double-strand break repair protein AddB n=1 Tax=Alsobacter soli TaxID=2109933 RepID=A0A2T1HNW1_9HYPH|nr:double-strand break repair protein AddB [Alsobacter soli]PSC03355.1 double-strand break repair protein AddB [Alsobacter soli]